MDEASAATQAGYNLSSQSSVLDDASIQGVPKRTATRWKRKTIMAEVDSSNSGCDVTAQSSVPEVLNVPRRTATRWKRKNMMADWTRGSQSGKTLLHANVEMLEGCGDDIQHEPVDNAMLVSFEPTSTTSDHDEEDLLFSASDTPHRNVPERQRTQSVEQDSASNHTQEYDSDAFSLPDSNVQLNIADDVVSHNETSDGSCHSAEPDGSVNGSELTHSDQYNNDLLLLVLKLRHKLSAAAVADLMKMCNFVTDSECVSKTNYLFDKQFSSVSSDFVFFYLCESCGAYVREENRNRLQKLKCTNAQCTNEEVRKQKKCTLFVYLPVKYQLQDLLENHDVENCLITTDRVKKHANNYEDILDGDLYKHAMPFSDNSGLSLSFNCDGVPVFSSSSCSIWPVLCTVNELPPQLRKSHVMLVALWFGVSKPVMNAFLEPFVQEMCELDESGFVWTRSSDGKKIKTKVKALVGICDSVARPTMQGFMQYNGMYGCSFCFDSGVSVAQGQGNTRAYPYNVDSIARTHEGIADLVEQAVAAGRSVLGVKGPTVLSLLPEFDVIQGLVPDYMHCVLLGVTRQLAKLWFDSSSNTYEYYITPAQQRLIDIDLSTIRPPCNVSRVPRSVSVLKYWKAHEWYMWLMYYSLPILKNYMPNKFYVHFALLVEGIAILISDSISAAYLDHSNLVLIEFVKDFEVLYGLNNVSFNVHLCLHLTSSVRAWGPLWSHSAFIYESFNGNLLEMIRGTQAVPLQICKTFALGRAIPRFCAKAMRSSECSVEYKDILKSFITTTSRVQHYLTIHGVAYLGRCRLRQLAPNHLIAVHFVAHHVPRETVVQYYDRIVIHGEIVHSHHYCRNLLRNSYTVSLEDDSIFQIEHFIVANFQNGVNGYALGYHYSLCRPLHRLCRHPKIALDLVHLMSIERDLGPLTAIPIARIGHKCIMVNNRNSPFDTVCLQLNMFEYCT